MDSIPNEIGNTAGNVDCDETVGGGEVGQEGFGALLKHGRSFL